MILETTSHRVIFQTELGWFGLAISRTAQDRPQIDKLTFGHPSETAARTDLEGKFATGMDTTWDESTEAEVQDWIEQLQQFATGQCVDLRGLRLNLDYLSDFGRQVIQGCRDIPWGRTLSYGELAKQVGSPGASRAVGGVMARNRHPLVVPCHRVIARSGALTGFSAPDGTRMKQRLLENEKALNSKAERQPRFAEC
ncbi:MAG: MGMT family protein [Planctomycetaceae bacterium]|nr:MGMT family protein [Planctomycetaceae bacterium]